MKKILLSLYIFATFLIIALHSQTIPFILLVFLTLILGLIYYRQRHKQKATLNSAIQERDVASIQLQYASAKPDSELLFTALAGIQSRIIQHEVDKSTSRATPRITLPLFGETRYIKIAEIIRCEADNAYTKFMLADGEEILVSKTLKEYAETLAKHHFIRTHQSHLVNIAHVKSWLREDGGSLLLTDGTKVPVSKLNREKVKEALANG